MTLVWSSNSTNSPMHWEHLAQDVTPSTLNIDQTEHYQLSESVASLLDIAFADIHPSSFSLLCSIPKYDYNLFILPFMDIGLFQFINSAKHIICWMHVNISVGYILGNEIAGSEDMPRFSLTDTADNQFFKVIIMTTCPRTGRCKNSSCSTSLPKFDVIRLINYNHSGGYPLVSHCNQTDDKLSLCIFSCVKQPFGDNHFCKMAVQVLCSFFYWLICLQFFTCLVKSPLSILCVAYKHLPLHNGLCYYSLKDAFLWTEVPNFKVI